MPRRAPPAAPAVPWLAAALLWGCAAGRAPAPDPTPLELRGEEALAAGRADEARSIFLSAIGESPRPFYAWIGVARASLALGDRRTAEDALTESARLDFGTARSADVLGRTLLMLAQREGRAGRRHARLAAGFFERAFQLDPAAPRLRYHLGLALWTADDLPSAVLALEAAYANDPPDDEAAATLLKAYAAARDGPAAARLAAALEAAGRGGVVSSVPDSRRSAETAPSGARPPR